MKSTACVAAAALVFIVGTGWAAPPDDSSGNRAVDPAESTIRVITDPRAEAPDAVTATIEWPPAVPTALPRARGSAHERGAPSSARKTADAWERGREQAAAMAEAARESRENLARRSSKPENPATVSLERSVPLFGDGPVPTIAAAAD